jgi:UDP-GlcNAc:undecaprenyl-phosphate GlcNAc-1-phosphate transferase
MFNQSILPAVIVFTSSLLIGCVILAVSRRLIINKRDDLQAVQAAHVTAVPRIGGIAIICALFISLAFQFGDPQQGNLNSKLLLSIVPILFVGLSEDFGLLTKPRVRILAAAASGALFMLLFGEWLPRADFPGLDFAVQWAPFAIVLSIFLTVGVSHAFNLIDGLNGLASFTAISAALALAFIANNSELYAHRDVMILLVVAIFGFVVLNFPFPKIFLGDAGAYSIGHMLAWMSISILWHADNVTPWAILLIFFWPVADTILAIVRRLAKGQPIAHPDRLHFHQLIMRAVEIIFLGRQQRRISNPLATVIMLPFIVAPMWAGVMLATDRMYAAIAVLFCTFFFITAYTTGITIATKMRNRRHR